MNEKNQLIVIALDKWGRVPESLELVEIVLKLEEENKALRENVNHRAWRCADLSEENERLKEKNNNLRIELEFEKWNTIFPM